MATSLRGPTSLDPPCFPNGNRAEQFMPPPLPTPAPNYSASKLEPSLTPSSTQVLPPAGSSVHHAGGYMQVSSENSLSYSRVLKIVLCGLREIW